MAFSSISIALISLSLLNYSWAGWRVATCMPDACFCERIRSGSVRQPANTWSSLGFVFVGLVVFAQAHRDLARPTKSRNGNPMVRHLAYGGTFALSLILIGLGSAFFHASLTFWGQFADVMGMYMLAGFIFIYNLSRSREISPWVMVSVYVLLLVVLGLILLNLPGLRRYIFGVMLLLALIPEYIVLTRKKPVIETRFLKAALLLICVGFFIWILDILKLLCSPDSWLQGHAIWHIFGAIAAGLLYVYYRSENQGLREPS